MSNFTKWMRHIHIYTPCLGNLEWTNDALYFCRETYVHQNSGFEACSVKYKTKGP